MNLIKIWWIICFGIALKGHIMHLDKYHLLITLELMKESIRKSAICYGRIQVKSERAICGKILLQYYDEFQLNLRQFLLLHLQQSISSTLIAYYCLTYNALCTCADSNILNVRVSPSFFYKIKK